MNTPLEQAAAIRSRKGGKPIAMLTAYDYPTARTLDEAGVDILLVGDSLGMVVLGYPDTTHVTLAHMLHHGEAVARAAKRALVVVDLPINTYDTPEQALDTSRQLVAAGAGAVKLEGGCDKESHIAAITAAGIPVMAHIGLLPQNVLKEGGYKMKGKTDSEIAQLHADAQAVARAGAFSTVIECTRADTARSITEACPIPTIGIGSGTHCCDGEVAVISDLVGAFPWFVPAFVQPRAHIAESITDAVQAWMRDVQGE